jgi:hypothetical protein
MKLDANEKEILRSVEHASGGQRDSASATEHVTASMLTGHLAKIVA